MIERGSWLDETIDVDDEVIDMELIQRVQTSFHPYSSQNLWTGLYIKKTVLEPTPLPVNTC
jgi:hypothetical protein